MVVVCFCLIDCLHECLVCLSCRRFRDVRAMIVCHVDVYRSMRVHFLAEADFVRPTDDEDDVTNCGSGDGMSQPTSRIRGYFHMPYMSVQHTSRSWWIFPR